jgi:tetrapyrrole methylase family protein / MazG family protein
VTIHIAGLGPGNVDLLTVEVVSLLNAGHPVVVRTRHHPSVELLDPARAWTDCDDLYAHATDFEATYDAVAQRVLGIAPAGEVVFAVPGHPLFAERSVERVLALANDIGVATKIHPGISYVDVAAAALHRDLGNVQLCDALDLRIDAQRPALISQLYDRDSVSQLKLALLEFYPGEHEVVVLRSLSTPEERAETISLSNLDHAPFGYLDSLFVPALDPEDDVRRLDGIHHVVARLNAPDGCPWDREQTHGSLRPHLLEEAYETLEAIDNGDPGKLAEELGDVLLQVLMHAEVGEREGTFTLGDVTESITRKLIRRHPHVFGDTSVETAEEVSQNWEVLKKQERPDGSILDGVPSTLPALAASQSIQGRARRIGFDWPDVDGILEKLAEEMQEFATAPDAANREEEFGDILFVLACVAEHYNLDSEQALRMANEKFRKRFGLMEEYAKAESRSLKEMSIDEMNGLWERAKAELRTGQL